MKETLLHDLVEAVLVVLVRRLSSEEPLQNVAPAIHASVSASAQVDAICQERHGLRLEVIQMERSMHGAVLAFVSVLAVFAGIYWDNRVIPDDFTRAVLLAVITQVEFFMALFMLALFVNQNVHVAYIRILEEKINELSGQTVTAWESRVTKHYLARPRSAFFWLHIFLFLFLLIFFLLAVIVVAQQLTRTWVIAVAITEVVSVVVLAIWALLEIDRISGSVREWFGIQRVG